MNNRHQIDLISIIKQDNQIKNLFKNQFPDLNIEQLEDELVKDIIESIYGESLTDIFNNLKLNQQKNQQQKVIENLYDTAITNIPEMLTPNTLIFLNGKINENSIKILFDTGANNNCIFKSKIIECGLENIVDTTQSNSITGIHGNKKTYGTIWYTDIELNNNSTDKNIKNDDNNEENMSTIIGLNFVVVDDENIDKNSNKFDAIIGINFMKSYKVNINFATQIITLNNEIKIKFE